MNDQMRNTFLFTVFVLISSIQATAQYVPMNTRISTPYGPATIRTYQYMPTHHYNYNVNYLNTKFTLKATLKNDSLVEGRSTIAGDSIQFITLKKDGEKIKIEPKDTKQLMGYYNGKKMYGIPADSCWLFQCVTGKINLYADRPISGLPCATAIQLDDGPILPLNKTNLEAMIPEDAEPGVLRKLERGKLKKAIYAYNFSVAKTKED